MAKIVTTKSVVLSKPVTDAKGKPVTEKVKFNGREVEHQAHEHTQHSAGTVLVVGADLDKQLAMELVEAGHAREHVDGLDEDSVVSPLKSEADPLA